MSLNRYAAQRDANEPDILKALEAAGWLVISCRQPFDLYCQTGREQPGFWVEVKQPRNIAGRVTPSQLTKAQREWIADGVLVYLVTSVSDVIELVKRIGITRRK